MKIFLKSFLCTRKNRPRQRGTDKNKFLILFFHKICEIDLLPIHIIFASLIMAISSFVIRSDYQQPTLDVFTQFLWMFCLVWLLFRIHIFYATIMTSMTYLAYIFIQMIYYYGMLQLGVFDENGSLPFIYAYSTYILQTLSALTAIGLGWWVFKRRRGFDFVPDQSRGRLRLKKRDKVMFFLNLPTVFLITAIIYLTAHVQQIFIVVPLIYACFLYVYLYLSYRRDRE
jgi:hypothetical protein